LPTLSAQSTSLLWRGSVVARQRERPKRLQMREDRNSSGRALELGTSSGDRFTARGARNGSPMNKDRPLRVREGVALEAPFVLRSPREPARAPNPRLRGGEAAPRPAQPRENPLPTARRDVVPGRRVPTPAPARNRRDRPSRGRLVRPPGRNARPGRVRFRADRSCRWPRRCRRLQRQAHELAICLTCEATTRPQVALKSHDRVKPGDARLRATPSTSIPRGTESCSPRRTENPAIRDERLRMLVYSWGRALSERGAEPRDFYVARSCGRRARSSIRSRGASARRCRAAAPSRHGG
jgi:hypothetical protein